MGSIRLAIKVDEGVANCVTEYLSANNRDIDAFTSAISDMLNDLQIAVKRGKNG